MALKSLGERGKRCVVAAGQGAFCDLVDREGLDCRRVCKCYVYGRET